MADKPDLKQMVENDPRSQDPQLQAQQEALRHLSPDELQSVQKAGKYIAGAGLLGGAASGYLTYSSLAPYLGALGAGIAAVPAGLIAAGLIRSLAGMGYMMTKKGGRSLIKSQWNKEEPGKDYKPPAPIAPDKKPQYSQPQYGGAT